MASNALLTRGKRLWWCSRSPFGRLSLIHNDSVSHVGGHDEIMFDNESSLLAMHDEALDNLHERTTHGCYALSISFTK
jgi:hypothetical protein